MTAEERAQDRRQRMVVRVIRDGYDDGSFDEEFWSGLGAEKRYEAAWQCVLDWAAFNKSSKVFQDYFAQQIGQ